MYVDPNDVQVPAIGDDTLAAWATTVRGSLEANIGSPVVRAYRTGPQSIPHDTLTVVNFNAGFIDSHSMHDPAGSDPDKFTVPDGWPSRFLLGAEVRWASSSAGSRRYAEMRINGTLKIDDDESGAQASGYATNRLSTLWSAFDRLTSPTSTADFFSLWVYQDSGSNLDILTDGYAGTSFWLAFQSLRNKTG